jgi:heme/copper-type cytochrome/quinol oxidase subunit 3
VTSTRTDRALEPNLIREELPERRSLGYLGMVVFLASWAMMFGTLFYAYAALRLRAPSWPPPGVPRLPVALPGFNTALLLISSATVQLALSGLRRGRLHQFRRCLGATIVLGILFSALQWHVWIDLWAGGLQLTTGTYGGVFYLMTVFHFLHVVVGLGLLAWLLAPALRRDPVAPRRVPVKLASMFWHFVDVVWLAIFVSVYLL